MLCLFGHYMQCLFLLHKHQLKIKFKLKKKEYLITILEYTPLSPLGGMWLPRISYLCQC